MPKTPIQSRTLYYTKLRDGSFRLLDFSTVGTSLGTMVEHRPMCFGFGNPTKQIDVYDLSFTDIKEINADQAYSLFGTTIEQVPRDFNNTQP